MTSVMFREAPTLHAINQLRRHYPYSAALLTYVVVERLLKDYLLMNRRDPKHAARFQGKKMSRGPHKGKTVAVLVSLPDGEFLRTALCHMTLGEVEEVLNLAQSARSSGHRNEAMHSNLYLSSEAALTYPRRHKKNAGRLKKAVNHLRYVVDHFTDHRLLQKRSGKLVAQPNQPMQPAGSAGG